VFVEAWPSKSYPLNGLGEGNAIGARQGGEIQERSPRMGKIAIVNDRYDGHRFELRAIDAKTDP
jgi:hypothetical protein